MKLPVTQSAANALRAVRKEDGVRLIWIDCLCISQTSNDEKAAQVAMMDTIFANAATVLIWLGADERGQSVAAAEMAERIHECFGDETRFRMRHPGESVAVKQIDPVVRQSYYDELGSVLPLFESEWFWRLWCVQELALAKSPVIHWGSSVLGWETVLTVAAFIESRAQVNVAHTGYAGVHNVIMLECLREQVRDWEVARLPFSRLLGLTRLHGVTEPCDRIFSLLGLDRQLNKVTYEYYNEQYADWWPTGNHNKEFRFQTAPKSQTLVSPDYSQGINRLYLSSAKAMLSRERNLHLLSFVQHESQAGHGNLPPWVPQWHINKHRLITQFDLLRDHPLYTSLTNALNKSTIRLEPRVYITSEPSQSDEAIQRALLEQSVVDDDGTLYTQGLLLATVVKSFSSERFTADHGHRWLDTLREWYHSVSAWFAQDRKPALPNTPQQQLDDKLFRMFYSAILGGHFRAKDVFVGLKTELASFRTSLMSGRTDDIDVFPTTRAFVTQICRSRSLFFTDTGQLGIGPQCLEPRDCVCFLAGAAVPLLLRPCSIPEVAHRHWVLVGETYVNGLADASLDCESVEGLEPLSVIEDGDPTRNIVSLLVATPTDQSFLETLDLARMDRSIGMLSNIKVLGDRWGDVYYSDLGKIEVKRSVREQDYRALFASSSGVTREGPGSTEARPYERIQFNIK